jgi:catechol-2,3-dioxygenase
MSVHRLNHAVLYVHDARRAAEFYSTAFGFETVVDAGGRAVFMRAPHSTNDHDLGLFSVGGGDEPATSRSATSRDDRRIGLYHLAWQVATIDDLVRLRTRLQDMGALTGESDHGVSKSLYGRDVDGIEFEVMWAVPREDWPEGVLTRRLDLDADVRRWAGVQTV